METYYTKNKEKRLAYKKEYYAKNKERLIEYQNKRYKKLSDALQSWKSTLVCSRCGENDSACIDFHHVNPEHKDDGVVHLATQSKQAIVKELKKCVAVCANCHRKIHFHNITVCENDILANSFEEFYKGRNDE